MRKSSRLRTKLVEDPKPAPAEMPRKKMLQMPGERPDKVEEETEEEEENEEENEEKTESKDRGAEEGEERLGESGHDSDRRLDPDLLLPFR